MSHERAEQKKDAVRLFAFKLVKSYFPRLAVWLCISDKKHLCFDIFCLMQLTEGPLFFLYCTQSLFPLHSSPFLLSYLLSSLFSSRLFPSVTISSFLVSSFLFSSFLGERHATWYSWGIGALTGSVYTFGFVLMCPQVRHRKSVEYENDRGLHLQVTDVYSKS